MDHELSREDLLKSYENVKNVLHRSRKEVLDAQLKIRERLDSIHNVTVPLITVLLAITVFSFARLVGGGKPKTVEIIGALVVLFACSAILVLFWLLLADKAAMMKSEWRVLNTRFLHLCETFEFFAKTKAERDEEVGRLERELSENNPLMKEQFERPAVKAKRLKLVSEMVLPYDVLHPIQRFAKIDIEEFKKPQITQRFNGVALSTDRYLTWLCVVIGTTAIVMCFLFIFYGIYAKHPEPSCTKLC